MQNLQLFNIFVKHKPEISSYSQRYHHYYSFDSFRNIYIYNLNILSPSQTLPEKTCPECGADLHRHKPEFITHTLGEEIRTFISLAVITIPVIIIALGFLAYNSVDKFYYLTGIVLVFDAFLILNHYIYTLPLKLYYCTKCDTLIYTKSPIKRISSDPPSIVFKKLEQIPGFKLK